VHLLLNGLLGLILGWRVALAIPVGLFLQAALFGHGGFTSLGLNCCVMTIPALVIWGLLQLIHRIPMAHSNLFRRIFLALAAAMILISGTYCIALLITNRISAIDQLDLHQANNLVFHPVFLVSAPLLSLLAGWLEARYAGAPHFALGFFLGTIAVLLTVFLNGLVLLLGGQEDWHTLVLVTFVVHIPLMILEGIVTGFSLEFLARVKPEILGWSGEKKL
jgi:ABC-type Co2+ transport system permease subunit